MNKFLMMALFLASGVSGFVNAVEVSVNNASGTATNTTGNSVKNNETLAFTGLKVTVKDTDLQSAGYISKDTGKLAELSSTEQALYVLKTSGKLTDLSSTEQAKYVTKTAADAAVTAETTKQQAACATSTKTSVDAETTKQQTACTTSTAAAVAAETTKQQTATAAAVAAETTKQQGICTAGIKQGYISQATGKLTDLSEAEQGKYVLKTDSDKAVAAATTAANTTCTQNAKAKAEKVATTKKK